MERKAVVVLAVLFAAGAVGAEERRPQKPIGTWERKVDDNQVTFRIKADGLHCTVRTNGATVEINADYGVTRDGTLFGIITKVEKQGADEGPAEGHLFSFHFTVDKNTLTVKDLKGTDNPEAQQLVEGEYSAVKGEKADRK